MQYSIDPCPVSNAVLGVQNYSSLCDPICDIRCSEQHVAATTVLLAIGGFNTYGWNDSDFLLPSARYRFVFNPPALSLLF